MALQRVFIQTKMNSFHSYQKSQDAVQNWEMNALSLKDKIANE